MVDTLQAAGVRSCYGIVGDAIDDDRIGNNQLDQFTDGSFDLVAVRSQMLRHPPCPEDLSQPPFVDLDAIDLLALLALLATVMVTGSSNPVQFPAGSFGGHDKFPFPGPMASTPGVTGALCPVPGPGLPLG